MDKTIEVKVFDIEALKGEAIRRWPQRGLQLHPNVLIDEIAPVAGVVRNGLWVIQGADVWGEDSPLTSVMEFLERYYETTDAFEVFKSALVEWRYYPVRVLDFTNRIGMEIDDLPTHPSMVRESKKAAKAEKETATKPEVKKSTKTEKSTKDEVPKKASSNRSRKA